MTSMPGSQAPSAATWSQAALHARPPARPPAGLVAPRADGDAAGRDVVAGAERAQVQVAAQAAGQDDCGGEGRVAGQGQGKVWCSRGEEAVVSGRRHRSRATKSYTRPPTTLRGAPAFVHSGSQVAS